MKFIWDSYPKSQISLKFPKVSVSVHVYNAQTKGIQHRSVVKLE